MKKAKSSTPRIPHEMIQSNAFDTELVRRLISNAEVASQVDDPRMDVDTIISLDLIRDTEPREAMFMDILKLRMDATRTGRLSCIEENLSNLRRGDEDIHRETAAKIMAVQSGEVTPTQRKDAAAINFGILYGTPMRALSRYREYPITGKETQWLRSALAKGWHTRKPVMVHLQEFNKPANMRTPGCSAMLAEFVGAGRVATPSMGASVPPTPSCEDCEKNDKGR